MDITSINPRSKVRTMAGETELRFIAPDTAFTVVESGKQYAAIVGETKYGAVPVGGRFKVANVWLVREEQGVRILDPNLPFGQPFDKPASGFMHDRPVSVITLKAFVPELKIGGKRTVRVDGSTEHRFMQDLRVLQVFAAAGHCYQLTKKRTTYNLVPSGGRFLHNSIWYRRENESTARQLDPNAPLADVTGVRMEFRPTHKVDLLVIEYRGVDERADTAATKQATENA